MERSMKSHPIALILGLSLIAQPAFSADKVIFFGGAQSKKSVLDACFPNFQNFGYPPPANTVAAVIAEINRNPDQTYLIVGHSSGAEPANQVATGIKKGRQTLKIANPDRITLMSLDGYAPSGVPKNIKRICWNASGGASKKPIKSRNFASMTTKNGCGQVKTYQDDHCKDVWCMHFTLVNQSAPASLDKTWKTQGYDGCSESQLPWYSP
jgi:hypothetical protein